MPRVGGEFVAPYPDVVPDTTIESEVHNGTVADLVLDANTARPVTAGGTGGINPTEARANLSVEVRGVVVTNYDSHAFEVGSFFSQVGATGAPAAPGPYVGICLRNSVTDDLWLSAVSQTTGAAYSRRRTAGVWGAWEAGTAYADTKVSRSGDAMSGSLMLYADPNAPLMAATKQYVDAKIIAEAAALLPRRNRITNGATQISQENGDSPGTVSQYYIADQWRMQYAASGGAFSAMRIPVTTPKGSPARMRIQVTTPDASLGVNDYLRFIHSIETMSDFPTSGKPLLLRFGWNSPAGTYSASLHGVNTVRSSVKNFTITAGQANTDVEIVLSFPPDPGGNWASSPELGYAMYASFCIACGSGNLSPSTGDQWQVAANAGMANANNTNGIAATGVFDMFDVGLYLDVDGTGVPPTWQLPDPNAELLVCQRYYYKANYTYSASIGAGGTFYLTEQHPTMMMRKQSPVSVTLSAVSHPGSISSNLTLFTAGTGFFILSYAASGAGVANIIYTAEVKAR